MTTDTDKLATAKQRLAALFVSATQDGRAFSENLEPAIAALLDAHIASLCGDVEPVAFIAKGDLPLLKYGMHPIAGAKTAEDDEGLFHVSKVAALKAERDAALARVAVLEKDAAPVRFDVLYAYACEHHLNYNLLCKIVNDALTKGQP